MKISEYRAPIIAGLVATVTGTLASTGIVLTGLSAVGANATEATSAICVMLIAYGVLTVALSWRFRMPISIVWSTPGAALLASASVLGLKFETAVGAFFVCGLLLALTAFWPQLGRLVSSIPPAIASAMLAGVILSFCTAPFAAIATHPSIALPVIASWLIMYRVKPLWAAPIAITVSAILVEVFLPIDFSQTSLLPSLTLITPHFELSAIVSLGIPLYIVTMASQNVPGIAIMRNFGFEIPFKAVMSSTGIATVVGSFFGGQALNLAAITAAINADEHADKDPQKRWVAAVTAGIAYLFVALATSVTVAFILQTPRELLLAGAGLALVGTITNALQTASSDPHHRIAAVITFLISASGISEFGIGAAFWALVGGLVSSYVVNFGKNSRVGL
ncbi:MAG: hypothetical protein RIS43_1011 [Actinomycetota bacterium]